MKTLFYFACLGLPLILSSCNKDKEDPEITIHEPAEHATFMPGDTIHLEVTFSDDQELKSYSIRSGDKSGNPVSGFDYQSTGLISGESYDYHDHIEIPETFQVNEFYLHFSVKDAEEKEGTRAFMLHTH